MVADFLRNDAHSPASSGFVAALETFHRLPAFDRLAARDQNQRSEFFDLDRFRGFLDTVGNPEKGLPVIHVTGSKGKGSTTALIAAGLQALGKRVGVFMSPYIHSPSESIFINGCPLSETEFLEHFEVLSNAISKSGAIWVSQFEVLTALALRAFHAADVDFAVMETGLGGRTDATNVIESPILSVICPIEKEHTQVLGEQITAIAYEKMGIVRKEIPVVVAHQDHFVLEFARSVCLQKKAPYVPVTGQYEVSVLSRSVEGFSFTLKTPTRRINRILLALLGDHQINNAVTAWAALDTLMPGFDAASALDVWAHVTLPGRFQRETREEREVILDGAHTAESARALRRTLDQLYPQTAFIFVLAFLDDKDFEGFGKNIIRWGDVVVLTQLNHPRALPARIVEQKLSALFPPERVTMVLTNTTSIAWQKALKMSHRNPICVTGSFKLLEVV